ncbi:MAG: hypothetical protein ABR956_10105 [Terracidiphilus sp.]|jgi:lysylphosphatidylglycerol synthetase-like protein (DUF2156 family)
MLKFGKPQKEQRSTVVFPALMAYWFAYCVYRLDRIRLHPSSIDLTLAVIMGLLAGGAWLVTTLARLEELNLSKAWIVALVAPFALSILALCFRWDVAFWSMLAAGVLAQWSLVFLLPGANAASAESKGSSRESA